MLAEETYDDDLLTHSLTDCTDGTDSSSPNR